MSSNSSDAIIINTLNVVSHYFNRYLSIAILLFGILGNFLNSLALSQRTLRSNPCASLFLASSIANIITLISGITVRLLASWSIDLTDSIGWLCKFRVFVLYASRTTALLLITLATIDRWLLSSINVHRRQLSTLKNAQRGIIIIICLSSLAYAEIFYCFEANLKDTPVKCYSKTELCRLILDLKFIFISVTIPSLLMLIFGLMTIFRLHQSSLRRIQPVNVLALTQISSPVERSKRWKKTDRYLFTMLFMQVILLTLFSVPQVIHSLYLNIIRDQIISSIHNAINNFILNLVFLLTYVTNGMPFYIYTLTGGTVFRKALYSAIQEFARKIHCQR